MLARTYTVQAKRVALLVCLAHTAQARAHDDLAEMLCKRMAATAKTAPGTSSGSRTVTS
ncbi:hypothetical protein ACIBP6_07580 [Nonomuraea terrae]|uniref:hypothetical protein n=1 Tax=Nonomuraea terrae TaxID=2530383 RepID=UPI0037B1B498